MKLAVTAILLLSLSLTFADRTVCYVHPDSTLNSIQTALDACSDNDIVLVGPGTYYENVVWPNTQRIHLVSELGSDTTIIDGGNLGRVLLINTGVDSNTVIRGFTFRNGFADNEHGGGIYCDNNSSPIIVDNIITNNYAGLYGGGIACRYSSPTMIDNTICHNIAVYIGGGILCYRSDALISGNVISDNQATNYYGGGIASLEASPQIFSNTVQSNVAYYDGGGIDCSNSGAIIMGDTIIDNIATNGKGGGISFYEDSGTTVSHCIISGNRTQYGGGISCQESAPTINYNHLENNTATERGGGIFSCIYSSPIIEYCTIANNIGDGLSCIAFAAPIVHYNDIVNNIGFGLRNEDSTLIIEAEYNWWGDSTGPYHPDSNPWGLGDSVSDHVDFNPWLYWPGVEDRSAVNPAVKRNTIGATIFAGPLMLPNGKQCKVFDITGRVVLPDKIKPGIYFIEVDGQITRKVVKVR